MNPPKNTELYEGELATFWFDESGILYAKSKTAQRTLARQEKTYELIRKLSGNKKICMLSEATHSAPQDKPTREYIAREMPNIFKAIAVISSSKTGQFITNAFLILKRQPVPIKLFTTEKAAKEWLKQYL